VTASSDAIIFSGMVEDEQGGTDLDEDAAQGVE
jgi:hypothetical protein